MPAAIGVLAGLRSQGLSVPEDVSVVAFHDAPIAAYLQPSLTTVRMPLAEMAARAVDVLIDLIEGRAASNEVIATSPEVIQRESACPPNSTRPEKDG
jgi:LacI family transcriptional regulator